MARRIANAHAVLKKSSVVKSDLDEFGRSPLHYAALDGNLDAVRRLVETGMDVSLPDNNARTPLHFSSLIWTNRQAALAG